MTRSQYKTLDSQKQRSIVKRNEAWNSFASSLTNVAHYRLWSDRVFVSAIPASAERIISSTGMYMVDKLMGSFYIFCTSKICSLRLSCPAIRCLCTYMIQLLNSINNF